MITEEKAELIYREMIQILTKSKFGMFDPYARERIMPLLMGRLELLVKHAKPGGFKIFTYDTFGGWDGEREYLQKFATQVSIVKDFHGKDKILVVVPRGVDKKVDEFIKQKD